MRSFAGSTKGVFGGHLEGQAEGMVVNVTYSFIMQLIYILSPRFYIKGFSEVYFLS